MPRRSLNFHFVNRAITETTSILGRLFIANQVLKYFSAPLILRRVRVDESMKFSSFSSRGCYDGVAVAWMLPFFLGAQLLTVTTAFAPPQSSCSHNILLQQKTTGSQRSSNSKLLVASSLPTAGEQNPTTTGIHGASSSSSSYIRWNTKSSDAADLWEFQTAVTTFQRTNPETKQSERIELHAQVHYGSEEYFQFYNSAAFRDKQGEVLYELLVDEALLGLSEDQSGRVLTQTLQASPNDQSLASGYAWKCQVDVMDYTQANWKHADFTRQELLKHQQQQQQQQQNTERVESSQPLWQQVSSSGTAFWQPAVSALLVGPPSLFVATDTTDTSFATKRKLFTNLFLPGNQFAGWLRAMLWMTVPSPEISVLLLDWSSLFLSKSSAKFSPVTLPILQSLMTLQVLPLRQLVFGQVLVAGNSAQQRQPQQQPQNQDWNLLVTQRNDHALQVLRSSLRRNQSKQLALLYGCSHCPDLHSKLAQDLGFSPIKTEWRTAWSVSVPTRFTGGEKSASESPNDNGDHRVTVAPKAEISIWEDLYSYLPPTAWAALIVLFPMYLGVGAVDWIDTIHSSAVSLLDENDALSFCGDWVLYLLRHVLLYVGVSKFALEWQDPGNNR